MSDEINTMGCGTPAQCSGCKFYYLQDEGYSNYTVIETMAHCMKKVHPAFPTDTSFQWEMEDHPILSIAEVCPLFEEGERVRIDVDRERMKWGSKDYSSYCESKRQAEALWEYKHGDVQVAKHIVRRNEKEYKKIRLMQDLG